MRHLTLVAVFVVGVAPTTVAAQYATSSSDTLRYSEVTNGRVEMATPNGTASVRSLHDAVLAVTFTGNGHARAWYEALVVESAGPMGATTPSTNALLKEPFELQFASTGHISGVQPPQIPSEIADMTDLTRQFDDFFITVPPGELPVGSAWADTVVNTSSARATDRTSSRHIRSYAVERDTTVDGVRAYVIRVTQDVVIDTSSEIPERSMTVSAKLIGTDEGWAIFAPSLGRMLERTRSGSLKGEMIMQSAGMAAMTMPQSFTYESKIQLRR